MPIQFVNTPIPNLQFEGKTVKEVYFENKLVYTQAKPMVVFETDKPFQGEVELQAGRYKVIFIGSGGKAKAENGGGSGAGFIGEIYLEQGKYTIYLWEMGNREVNVIKKENITLLSVGSGAHGTSKKPGNGGYKPNLTIPILSETLNVEGNRGNLGVGGSPVYMDYGRGYSNLNTPGTVGYIQLTYLRSK